MAEGHTIHRLAKDLRELVGSPVGASSPQGRFQDAKLLDGSTLLGTDAHGKHLFLRFEIGFVHIHLGLAGKFFRNEAAILPKPQVRLRLATEEAAWDLVAPVRCELLDDAGVKSITDRLGPDPLRPDADPERVWKRLERYPGPIGAALLDQTVVAGVGNVYRAELLYALRISPRRAASVLTRPEFDRLWRTLRSMMEQGVKDGRIVTVATAEGTDRTTLPQEEARYVYKQTICRGCGAPIEVASIGRRTSYACTREQS